MLNMVNTLELCTGVISSGIPDAVGSLVHMVVLIIQVVVPILLIIWGMLDFAKAIIGQDEDAIKKGQKLFIKRLIAALVVFLIITIVQLLIGVVGGLGGEENNGSEAWKCAEQLISGKASGSS